MHGTDYLSDQRYQSRIYQMLPTHHEYPCLQEVMRMCIDRVTKVYADGTHRMGHRVGGYILYLLLVAYLLLRSDLNHL